MAGNASSFLRKRKSRKRGTDGLSRAARGKGLRGVGRSVYLIRGLPGTGKLLLPNQGRHANCELRGKKEKETIGKRKNQGCAFSSVLRTEENGYRPRRKKELERGKNQGGEVTLQKNAKNPSLEESSFSFQWKCKECTETSRVEKRGKRKTWSSEVESKPPGSDRLCLEKRKKRETKGGGTSRNRRDHQIRFHQLGKIKIGRGI